jgi:hypothetical protein
MNPIFKIRRTAKYVTLKTSYIYLNFQQNLAHFALTVQSQRTTREAIYYVLLLYKGEIH